jgi:hypothetical protein
LEAIIHSIAYTAFYFTSGDGTLISMPRIFI